MIGEEVMNILTHDGKIFINYNNATSLRMYETDNGKWRISVAYTNGSYDVITQPGTEQECQNEFDRLCNKIATCREYDTIDMGDLWD
jgi:hypothetical protein